MNTMSAMETNAKLRNTDDAEVRCEEFYQGLDELEGGGDAEPGYAEVKKYLEDRAGIEGIHADVVCAGDTFEYRPGVIRRHAYQPGKDRGRVYAVYARAVPKGGAVRSVILARHEVEIDRGECGSPDGSYSQAQWEDMARVVALCSLAEGLGLEPEVLEWCRRLCR